MCHDDCAGIGNVMLSLLPWIPIRATVELHMLPLCVHTRQRDREMGGCSFTRVCSSLPRNGKPICTAWTACEKLP